MFSHIQTYSQKRTLLGSHFVKLSYNINVNVSGQGEVQKKVVGGGTEFTHGSTIELTAVPADDYSFFYWDGNPGDTENPKLKKKWNLTYNNYQK